MKKLYILLTICLLSNIYANEIHQKHSHNKIFQAVPKKDVILVKQGSTKNFCSVCGMNLTKFYKTNHVAKFKDGHKEQYCSIHCQTEVHNKHKDKIENIKVVDTKNLNLIDAKKALYVVGSSKKGTMSMISKYAFSKKEDALEFQKKFGGKIYNFEKTLTIAKNDLSSDYKTINKKRIKKAIKGKKIYQKMCSKISKNFTSVAEAKQYIIDKKPCKRLSPKMTQAVAIYIFNPSLARNSKNTILIPKHSKCPVCGMFVEKYPKWVASIKIDNGKIKFFDGVKDMMKFYFNPTKFLKNINKNQFKEIQVTDFYTLKSLEAKKAYYVIGSNIYGPMGEELIPFETKEKAQKFLKDHFGKKILNFKEIKEEILY